MPLHDELGADGHPTPAPVERPSRVDAVRPGTGLGQCLLAMLGFAALVTLLLALAVARQS